MEQQDKSREKFLADIADAYNLQDEPRDVFLKRFVYKQEGKHKSDKEFAKLRGISVTTLSTHMGVIYKAFAKSPQKSFGCDIDPHKPGRGKLNKLYAWLWLAQFRLWRDDYRSWKAQFPTLPSEFWESPSEQERKRAEIAEIELLNSQSQSLLLSHDQLGALVAAVKAGRKLQNIQVPPDVQIRIVVKLHQAVYAVRELNRFQEHSDSVTSISFSPDGKKLASASEDGTVRIWHLNGTLPKTLKNTDSFIKVWDVKFGANSKTLASADERGRVVLWNLDHSTEFPILEHDTKATSVSFSTDGEMLASGDYEGKVKLWSLKLGELEPFQLDGNHIHSISFMPNSQMLAVAIDNKVKLLILNGTKLESFTYDVETYGVDVVSVSFSSDAETLASASWGGVVGLRNQNSDSDRTITLKGGNISSISLSPNGRMLASAGDDGIVRLWNLEGEGREPQTFRGHTNIVNRVSFSPVGETLASAGADGSVRLWSLNGNELQTFQGHSKCVTHVSFSPDGRMLASASEDKTVKLWNLLDGSELQKFQATNCRFSGVRFSSDSRMLVFASDLKTVEFWSIDGRKEQFFKISEDCSIMSLSSDGQRYAQWDYKGTVTLYNSMDGALIKSVPSESKPMSFSPNGKMLALNGGNGIVELWNLDSGKLLTFQAHTKVVESVAFSSDSQMLASASQDTTVRLWSIDGNRLQIFQGHRDWVTSVCFSPDGQMLASADLDGTVRLWSINGGELHTFHGHSCQVHSVAFSRDGQMLASADLHGTIILWNLNLEDLLKRGCDWLRDYLKTNPNVSESDRHLCDGY